MNLGKRLKTARLKRGHSLRQLGALIGISAPSISAWETGKANPTFENLSAVADALNTNFEWLATGRIPKEFGVEGLLNENEYEAIPIIPPISPDWQETLHGIAELPQDQRDELRRFIDRVVLKKPQ